MRRDGHRLTGLSADMSGVSCLDLAPDDVVISGIGGIFPQSDNMDELASNLLNNINMLQEVNDPTGLRCDLSVSNIKGEIRDKFMFDATFFGISAAQTSYMDSLTWRILEKSYEAIVDSGHNPRDLQNSNTAVIMGSFISKSETFMLQDRVHSSYILLGYSRALLANRVAYWLNTKGPSYAYYSEEMAGISGLTLVYEWMKTHQCDSALVGTIDFVARPELPYHYNNIRRTKSRGPDVSELECIRSEACIVMYLQRAKHAKRIYASLVHSDYMCYGSRNTGFVRKLSEPMLELLERFYAKCHVDPEDIDYLETSSYYKEEYRDIEMEAVEKVFLTKRQSPLLTGSVKTNLGNTGSSTTFCSIAKILIAMEHGVIPADLHPTSSTQDPHTAGGKLQVVSENTQWTPKYAAVNAMDISGQYGHILLRSNMKQKPVHDGCTDGLPRLVCVSGRNEEGVKKILHKITGMPLDMEFIRLLQDVHCENITKHNYRGYVIIPSETDIKETQHFDGSKRPVWFVFSGMGSQWPGMGTHLMKLPVIADTIHKCHSILQPRGVDLINILTSEDPHTFDNILHSFVGIAAVQLALVETLRLLNIEPDGIIGHSVGELGCAYADGCFTMEQMILAAYYRGMASLEAELTEGRMAAVGLGYNKVKTLVPPTVDVACHNSEDSSTISGPSEDISKFVSHLKSQLVFAREVNVSNIAYHSRYIRPAAPKLLQYLKQAIPEPQLRSSRWHSTSAPEELWDMDEARYSSAEYHTNNLLNPVLFEETSRHIPKNAILIEIAPHGLLQAILKRSMGADCTKIALTQRGNQHGLEFLLSAIGRFYLAGRVPTVSALYPPVQFPVSRGTPSISSLTSWDHNKIWNSTENMTLKHIGAHNNSLRISLNETDYSFLKGYKVNSDIILPISAVLIIVWNTIRNSHFRKVKKMPVIFEKINIGYMPTFSHNGTIELNLSFGHASGNFEISEEGKETIFLKGKVTLAEDISTELSPERAVDSEEFEELGHNDIYTVLQSKSYEVCRPLRKIHRLVLNNKGSRAAVEWSQDWAVYLDSLLQLVIFHANEGKQKLQHPTFIQKLVINPLEQMSQKEYVAVFNKFSSSVRCRGVEMRGIKIKELPNKRGKNILIHHTAQFVPYKNVQCQNSNQFIDTVLQLLLENIGSLGNNMLTMTELVDGTTSSVNSELKNIVSTYFKDKVVFSTVSADEAENINKSVNAAVLVASDSTTRQALAVLTRHGGFMLATLDHNTELETGNTVAVIAEQQFGNRRWVLLKKCLLVDMKAPVIYLPRVQNCTPDDISHKNYNSRRYFVIEVSSFDEVKDYISFLTGNKKHGTQSCRFVFLMDSGSPPFSLSNQFYRDQLSLDMVVNIHSGGRWGSLRKCEVPAGPVVPHNHLKTLEVALRDRDFDWQYVGINNNNICAGDQETKGFSIVDLSGYTATGHRVMCVARVDPDTLQMITDPHMMWPVPTSWSLEDAVTVPCAYLLAYYALTVRTHTAYSKNILIQAGHCHVGQAFIAVALQLGLEVHTTVASDTHRQHLLNKFPQLQDSYITNLTKNNIENKILSARNNKGFDIVVNLLEEPFFQKSVSLVNKFGFMLQLCRTEMLQNKEFGMSPFLNNIAVFGIISEMMFDLNPVQKTKLHDLMMEGINAGTVQPFQKSVFFFSQEHEMLRTLHDFDFTGKTVLSVNTNQSKNVANDLQEQKETDADRFVIDSKKLCFIFGDKPEDCLVLAEWLVHRGCRELTLYCAECTVSNLTRRYLRVFRTNHHAHVSVVPLEEFFTSKCADNLLGDDSTGSLAAVFVLPVQDLQVVHLLKLVLADFDSVKYLAVLLNNKVHDIVDARRNRELAALSVQWDDMQATVEMRHILGQLDKLLIRMPRETVYLSADDHNGSQKLSSCEEQVLLMLPSSMDELAALGDDLMTHQECFLEEVNTSTPRMIHVREVHPVYIVPGLQGPATSTTEVLTHHLMCPAVIVHIPAATDNLQDNVAAVAQDMMELQRGGVYNIVGVSWGGVYALELAKWLEAHGEHTHVILVDGAPQTNQAIARHLGEGSQLQVNLLTTLLKLSSGQIHKDLLELPDWDSRLQRALAELSAVSASYKMSLGVAVGCIYSRMNTLLNYSSQEVELTGNISLIQPTLNSNDNYDLSKYFKTELHITLVDGNHRTLLENKETARVISDCVAVDLHWKQT